MNIGVLCTISYLIQVLETVQKSVAMYINAERVMVGGKYYYIVFFYFMLSKNFWRCAIHTNTINQPCM